MIYFLFDISNKSWKILVKFRKVAHFFYILIDIYQIEVSLFIWLRMFFNLWSVCERWRLGEVGVVFWVFLIIVVMGREDYYLHEVLHVTSRSCRLRSLNAIPCLALAEDSGHEQSNSPGVWAASTISTIFRFWGWGWLNINSFLVGWLVGGGGMFCWFVVRTVLYS